jgi:hypothetical protein
MNNDDAQSNLRKLSGVKQEEQRRIITDLSKQIGTIKDDNDYERMIKECQRRIKNIRDFAVLEDEASRAKGVTSSKDSLAGKVFEKCVQNFDHYSKDELLVFLCQSFSETILNEVV